MPIELTDEDRKAIELATINPYPVHTFKAERERIYRAGLAAGIERAAKACEYVDKMIDNGLKLKRGDHAAAVRSLLK